MHRKGGHFAFREDSAEIRVEYRHKLFRLLILSRIQRLHFRLQRIFDVDSFVDAPNGTGQVIGQSHDKSRAPLNLGAHADPRHGFSDQSNDLRRNICQQFRHMIRITTVGGDESPDDLGLVNTLPRLGLEAKATPSENHFAFPVFRQDNIVIEYAKHFHCFRSLPDIDVVSAGCRALHHRPSHRYPSSG